MKTIKLPYSITDNDIEILDGYYREYGNCLRLSYNRLKDGLKQKEIRNWLAKNIKFNYIDSWFIQSSIYKAMSMYEKDIEFEKKNNIFPKRIFGGKHTFIKRCKDLITKQDYKTIRNSTILSIGEAPKKGNRKFEFYSDKIIFKPKMGIKIDISLPKLKNSYKKDYLNIIKFANENKLAIQIEMKRDFIYITFDETKLYEKKDYEIIKGRYCGIDLNPNYIGISIVENEKVIHTQLFDFKNITGKNCNYNKLNYENIHVCHEIGRMLHHYKVEFCFIEDLKFIQGNKNKGKWFNRLTQNQWNKNIPLQIISKYVKCFKVNSVYSSTIGNIMFPEYPDPIAASLEIGRRGHDVIIKKNKKFYPDFIPITKLQDRWKETDFSGINDWKTLHVLLKESKVKYRIPIPKKSSFKSFQNRKSKVFTCCI